MSTFAPVAILAGGLATRLQPITEKIPKLLVKVAGEPFFNHQLRLLRSRGVTDVVVCAGHFAEQIIDRYGNGDTWGIRIQYSLDGPKLVGTGGALIRALPALGSVFFVLYGDSYLPVDYRAVADRFHRSGLPGLMTVYENHGKYDASNVWYEDDAIKVYDKRQRIPQMRYIDYGLGMFHASAFDGFSREEPLDLADLQKTLASRGELAGFEMKERFYEIGSFAGLNELDALLRRGQT